MKYAYKSIKGCLVILMVFGALQFTQAQNGKKEIADSFQEFKSVPKSNIYLHVNKSILVQGEDLGFSAYVFDHVNQIPSADVTNLYCQFLDSTSIVIKEKLLKVENGTAHNVFAIDSLLAPGNYRIRAFTNWMKNFENPQFFETSIKVLSATQKQNRSSAKITSLDVQIMPEGGHLVAGILTNVGVSIKDEYGRSVDGLEITVLSNGSPIMGVKLDGNGHGRFSIKPLNENIYTLSVRNKEVVTVYSFPKIDETGVGLSVNEINNKLFVELKSNEKTLANLSNPAFILAITNNNTVQLYDALLDQTKLTLSFNTSDLNAGVNQITLLTADKKIIAERLFFNYDGFELMKSAQLIMKRELDSVETKINFSKLKDAQISISVLPVETIAIDKTLSIVSKFKLEPYIKGFIQNPLEYFEFVDRRTKYQMDNLMLCQGWNMYDWDEIFNVPKDYVYNFEQGLIVKAFRNGSKENEFMILPARNTKTALISIEEGKDFIFGPYFPSEGEKLKISALDKKGNASKTKVYPQFTPSIIPQFNFKKTLFPLQIGDKLDGVQFKPFKDDVEELDQIVIEVKKEQDRVDRIKNTARGQVEVFTDADRRRYFNIDSYLTRLGFTVTNVNGVYRVRSRRAIDRGVDPLVVINGATYFEPSILFNFQMFDVDYIEIDFSGFSEYGSSRGGLINIRTDPKLNPYNSRSQTFSSYDTPLSFSLPSKFYKPGYYFYNDNFFNKLGVVDWQGALKVENGTTSFKMPYYLKNKLLFRIQGMTSDGTLIDEYKIGEMAN
ncbi:TonB-dependent receptor [Nonlabens antarcticus]|uniref:hypothetical protein n=1 Tax=Nonlabens antarcticus TaxID=392714 RepID=UPI0018912038|nr:hypothetical protein [Nonlabens antarcticus]